MKRNALQVVFMELAGMMQARVPCQSLREEGFSNLRSQFSNFGLAILTLLAFNS